MSNAHDFMNKLLSGPVIIGYDICAASVGQVHIEPNCLTLNRKGKLRGGWHTFRFINVRSTRVKMEKKHGEITDVIKARIRSYLVVRMSDIITKDVQKVKTVYMIARFEESVTNERRTVGRTSHSGMNTAKKALATRLISRGRKRKMWESNVLVYRDIRMFCVSLKIREMGRFVA